MQTGKQRTVSEFGHHLVDSISLPDKTLNTLFAALLLAAAGVFIGGNVLLLDISVLQRSAQIALPCFAMLLIFYTLSRTVSSVAWGLVLTYGLMWVLTYSRQVWLIPVVYALAVFGLIYTIRFLRMDRQYWASIFLMAVIATATVLGCTRAYTSFDMLHRLYAGHVHQDTLYHASIAAMIKNYGVVSTGLHGLVETPYHILSHVLMASISSLSGLGVIEVYGVANWVLFAPILIFSVTTCCAMLDREGLLRLPLVWGVVCVLLVVSPFLLSLWAVWDSFFVSESYLVSLGLFLLGLPLLFKRRLDFTDLFLVLVLAALISNAKASVGLIFVGLWFTRIVFVRGEKPLFVFLALLSSMVAVSWVVFASAEANAESVIFQPLHFIRVYSFLGEHLTATGKALLTGSELSWCSTLLALVAVLSFFTFHFALSWIVVAQVAFKKGVLVLLKAPIAVYSLAAIFAGTVIIFLFSIPGGAVFYFSNVAFFVSLPGVVALSSSWISHLRVPTSPLLVFGIILVCLLSIKAFYKASALYPPRSIQPQSAFIDSLIELRHITSTNIVIQPDVTALAENPVARCTAQPFVFPAVSERLWINTIATSDNCNYRNYGYAQYGIADPPQHVTVQPPLLPGMKILNWPNSLADGQSSN